MTYDMLEDLRARMAGTNVLTGLPKTSLDRFRDRELPYAHLRDLEVGAAFRFYADDLPDSHVIYRLAEKSVGRCMIDGGPRTETRTIKGRDRRGQIVERTITAKVSGVVPCAGGAQVVPVEVTT